MSGKISPFYSSRPGTSVYHNNKKCTEGNNIEKKYKKSGTGGHRLCSHCARIS